jgi:hypothetical protein
VNRYDGAAHRLRRLLHSGHRVEQTDGRLAIARLARRHAERGEAMTTRAARRRHCCRARRIERREHVEQRHFVGVLRRANASRVELARLVRCCCCC